MLRLEKEAATYVTVRVRQAGKGNKPITHKVYGGTAEEVDAVVLKALETAEAAASKAK